jgi:molybdate transport system ATP-binding protein
MSATRGAQGSAPTSSTGSSTGLGLEVDVALAQGAFTLEAAFGSDARALGIFGPSGSGKTTLVEALAGWRRPARGRIALAGEVWFDHAARVDRAPAGRAVGYVPQDGLLFPHWTLEQNLRAGLARAGADGARALARAIEVLELGSLLAQRPSELSGGERQRVALARALASGPRILLLDEPFAGLDLPLRRRLLPYLARVRAEFDVPLVLVSHDPTEILAVCERCVRLERGRVQAFGTARSVLLAAAREAGAFENVLHARVLGPLPGPLAGALGGAPAGPARVALAPGVELSVAGGARAAGADALVALRAEDVLVATGELPPISARNVLRARVIELVESGDDAWLEAELAPGVGLTAHLTPASARELDLCAGRDVRLVVKTQACRLLA